ncbi:MAG TPA: glycoside hydrolase family 3 N-terminal domain-containing protein [Ktedonobacterales bacterium]
MKLSRRTTHSGLLMLIVQALAIALVGCSPFSSATAAPPVPTATPKPPTAEDYAAKMVSGMSLDDKLGQMIIMQFYEPTYTAQQKAMVVPVHPGGVILYDYSMGTATQVKALLASGQQDSPIPMLTVLDAEGRYVDRLNKYLPPRLSAPEIVATNSLDVSRQQGTQMAQDLLSFGFNTDLAPDVDVDLTHGTGAIQWGRTFGIQPDPAIVTSYASAWTDALQRQGVIACAKHFPGLGATTLNPHATLPTITRTRDQLEAVEWAPYRAMIQSGQLQMIMSTDLLLPAVDKTIPAELSKPIITGILRDELHFTGVAVTDALYMTGISDKYTVVQAAVLAYEAGNDMIMAPWRPSMMTGIVAAMKKELDAGRYTQAQVDASVTRILALKIRMGLLKVAGYTPSFANGIGAPVSGTAATATTPTVTATKTP